MSHASGLAASIRGSTASDTFDLAGLNVSTIATHITSAFESPLPISEMIRVTLITGAGKLGRQKYDDNAAKAVTSALRDLGFEEDRGASCIPACAGSFKLQHDTGKNLKTVVVFPRIREEVAGENHHGAPGGSLSRVEEGGMSALLEKGSPREMIALSSKDVFENIVKTRCQTWSQKRGCSSVMSELMTLLQDLEAKLVKGVSLSDLEQSFYDNVSGTALEEKQSFVKDQMHHQVDEGMITSHEKTQLLAQVQERLDHIAKELDDAQKKGQSQKVEKIKKMHEKAEARKEKLSNIVPKPNPPLKHHAEIFKLRSELKPLLELEDGARGRLLSLKEAQSLARKDEILDKVADLEEKSRGWFEEEDTFKARVEACNAAWVAQNKAKKGTQKAGTRSAAAPASRSNAWVTTNKVRPQGASMSSSGTSNKKSSSKGGGVFAAMMMDSDSE